MEQFLVFLQKSPFNMLLFGLAAASGAMLLWPLIARPFRATHEVGTFEAVQLINRRDALVLDVRSSGEYAAGHIANARHLPEAQVAERIKELDKHRARPIIVSCSTGSRAPAVSNLLRKQGLPRRSRCAAASRRGSRRACRWKRAERTRGMAQKITMYSTGVCPFCQMAERLLRSKGVAAIVKIRVDLEPERRVEMMEKTGRRTVPQIYIGERHVGGFDELAALDRAGGLDPLLRDA